MVTAGNRTLHFASGDTLIVAAETPTVSQITQASPKQPYLALVVELDPATIGDLMKQVPLLRLNTGRRYKRTRSMQRC